MEQEKQPTFEQKNHQFRIRLEQLQDAQIASKKEQRRIEEQQEAFFELQQQEQSVYNFVLSNCEPEERAFIEERGDDSLRLAKNAQREFDEELLQLKKEERQLFDQEETVLQEQRAFLETSKEGEHGA